jgi:hypothetical protein
MAGALLTPQSVDAFRRWMDAMPRGVFEKRVTGACDASMPDEQGEQERRLREKQSEMLALLRKGIPLRVAHALFEFFRPKADTEDELRQLWTWLSSYVVEPPRRNGHV